MELLRFVVITLLGYTYLNHVVLQLKLKYTPNSNMLEVLLIAAYNLSCSASTIVNPVVKIALLLSDR